MSVRVSAPVLCAALFSVVAGAADSRHSRIVVLGGGPPHIGLFVADADGQHETPFLPSGASDYNASFSSDGNWIVFTSDRAGSADVYRVRPDGSGLERLTDSPAFDDQGTLSPDGRTLAFVSSRDGGTNGLAAVKLGNGKLPNRLRDCFCICCCISRNALALCSR